MPHLSLLGLVQMRRDSVWPTILVFVLVLSLSLGLGGCNLVGQEPSQPASTATLSPPASSDWFTIFFTDPQDPQAATYRGGPDASLAAAIDQASLSVDVAAYDLNLWSLRDALVAAHRRGLTVRVVVESDNLDEAEIQDLKAAGIPVLGDRREGLMHNKFVVLDHLEVWTGSMNFTTADGYLNDNNLVRIRSTNLAQNYTSEFDQMFKDDRFGPDKHANTPYPTLTVDGTRLENYFAPQDRVAGHLVKLVQEAQESIFFLAFSFTSNDLASALLERAQAGVEVAGVMEEAQVRSNIGSDYERFRQAGLDVRLDGNARNMHHKVLIIDRKVVVFGSYNFSASAETHNDENVIVLYNPQVADRFLSEFERIYAHAQK